MAHPKSRAYREFRARLDIKRTGAPARSFKDDALDRLERALDTSFSKHGQRRKHF